MIAQLDLFDGSFVDDPFPLLASLRRDRPVHHDSGTGLWLVSRHADVKRVLMDPDTYRPDNAQDVVFRPGVPALRVLARAGFALPPALANNGGPAHAGLRRLVSRFMNAERVRAAVPLIEETARELLRGVGERLAAGRICDLVAGYARPLPCRVMMRLLGIDGATPAELLSWSDAALRLFYGRPSPDEEPALAEQVAGFHGWLTGQLTQRRTGHSTQRPHGGPDQDGRKSAAQDGLMGALAAHRLPDGRPLDVPTAVAVCFFVLIAGQATTGQLIATVLRTAGADPQVWERAGRQDGFAAAYVEEVLRREPPVTTWRRITARPARLAGVRLPAGAGLLLMLMGTGSDPEVFSEPERLLPGRPELRRHLSFGAGRHRCPGASLARTEAAVALRTAARLLPAAEPAGGRAPMLDLLSFRAPTRVPVRLGHRFPAHVPPLVPPPGCPAHATASPG
jgi:cytochrome P450